MISKVVAALDEELMMQRRWQRLANGDIWTDEGKNSRPVAYRVGDGWMIAGVRSRADIYAISEIISRV